MIDLWYFLLLAGIALSLLFLAGKKLSLTRRRRTKAGSRARSIWGSVYVNQLDGHHYKIGFTQQLAKKRQYGIRSAVKARTGAAPKMRQVIAIDMCHARKVERKALDALEQYRSPIGPMQEFFRFPAGADPSSVIDHIGTIVQAAAHEVRDEMIAKGRWTSSMERAARIVRLTHDGRQVRQPLFIKSH